MTLITIWQFTFVTLSLTTIIIIITFWRSIFFTPMKFYSLTGCFHFSFYLLRFLIIVTRMLEKLKIRPWKQGAVYPHHSDVVDFFVQIVLPWNKTIWLFLDFLTITLKFGSIETWPRISKIIIKPYLLERQNKIHSFFFKLLFKFLRFYYLFYFFIAGWMISHRLFKGAGPRVEEREKKV